MIKDYKQWSTPVCCPLLSADMSMFEQVEVGKRPKETSPSKLGLLLAEYYKQTANPFFDYGRWDGLVHTHTHTHTHTQTHTHTHRHTHECTHAHMSIC